MDFFIVRDVDTGKCLPFTKKGYTTAELEDPLVKPPRLFTSKRGAVLAKAAWLKGVHVASWDCWSSDDPYSSAGGVYVECIQVQKKPDRARVKLEIVKAHLHLEI